MYEGRRTSWPLCKSVWSYQAFIPPIYVYQSFPSEGSDKYRKCMGCYQQLPWQRTRCFPGSYSGQDRRKRYWELERLRKGTFTEFSTGTLGSVQSYVRCGWRWESVQGFFRCSRTFWTDTSSVWNGKCTVLLCRLRRWNAWPNQISDRMGIKTGRRHLRPPSPGYDLPSWWLGQPWQHIPQSGYVRRFLPGFL